MKSLICLGDSITAREVSEDGTDRLTPRLRFELVGWKIINASVSGDNTRDVLARLKNDILNQNPDLVTVLLGANDAAAHKIVSLKEYEFNLSSIARRIGSRKTILISPSPVDENRPRNRTNEVLKEYSDVVEQVSISAGCQFINLFSEMIKHPNYTSMLIDGLHFNELGYRFLSQLIVPKVRKYYS